MIGAEEARISGYPERGNAFDIARLAIYWFWLRSAWHCAGNVDNPVWTPLTRLGLSAGLVVNALV